MSLRRNVIANYLGQGWSALMGLAFVPIYIRYLGIESYGLIGLFAAMQIWLSLLDMGMTPTLGREMARFTAGAHSPQAIRNLLRSLEWGCLGIALLVCLCVWATSDWLARDWLRAEKLSPAAIVDAVDVLAIVVALRFVEGIYRSALVGLQRQVWYNAVNAALSTLRGAGAVVLLAVLSPTLRVFAWQAVISLATVAAFAFGVYRSLPQSPMPAIFSGTALLRIWRFAGGMMGIAVLSVVLTQIDKLMLSRLLTLKAFGLYSLAATVTGVLYLVVTPVTTALYPRLVELVSLQKLGALASTYHRGAQLVTVLTATPSLLLAFFSEGILFAWSGDVELARGAGTIVSALALGTFLNTLMYMPYQLQLAHGWTRLIITVNAGAVLLLVPSIYLAVPRYGALAAAWIWLGLNIGYMLLFVQAMHRRLLPADKWAWYVRDVGLPAAGALLAVAAVYELRPHALHDRATWVLFLSFVLVVGFVASSMTHVDIRSRLFLSLRRLARI